MVLRLVQVPRKMHEINRVLSKSSIEASNNISERSLNIIFGLSHFTDKYKQSLMQLKNPHVTFDFCNT